MPRNVRNFWIELEVDGRTTKVACGPVNKDGGFYMTIKMRDEGEIATAWRIIGRARDGDITLTAESDMVQMLPIVIQTTR